MLSGRGPASEGFSLDKADPPPPRGSPDRAEEQAGATSGVDTGEMEDEGDDLIADDGEEEEEEDVPAGGSIRILSVFVFLAVVVLAYLALAFTFAQNPGWALRVTQELPLIGGVRDRLLTRSVTLTGIEGHYERSREGKPVLLVTGQAHNQTSVSLNRIQIITKLFDGSNRQLDEQLAFCGHSVRPELVRDLTVRQIAILKGLKPPQRFNVQPGETCDFVTIFTEMSAPVATFTAEVSAAQRHA
jgi:hypothetical protein